jgi:predicted permease
MGDLRFAARMLAKNPGFAAVAVLLLALGIGASAVIFSALDAILLRPLPVRNPEQLVRLVQRKPRVGTRSSFSQAYFEALRDHSTTLAAVFGDVTDLVASLNEPGPAIPIRVHLVTPEFFPVLGVPALYGRTLGPADDRDMGTPPAVLSDGFWRTRFNADPQAVGRTFVINRRRFAIVGVMPPEFNGISVDTRPEVRVLLRTAPLLNTAYAEDLKEFAGIEVAGRLKPGVTMRQAEAECRSMWRASTAGKEDDELRYPLEVEPLERGVSVLRDRFGTALMVLIACVGLLQLMVCANLAGLLLARASGRREEMAVRLAVGATRARLVRQMLTECALLTVLGMAGGIVVAFASAPLLVRALPPMRDAATEPLALALNLTPDGRVLGFMLVVSAVTALLFGTAPAISSSRVSLDRILRATRSAGGWRGRQVLIVFQIALCTLLLAGAGLLVRTLERLENTNPGFDRDRLVSFTASPSLAGYSDPQTNALRLTLLQRVREIPGVMAAATADRPLMRGSGMKTTVTLPGQRATPADFMNASLNSVSPEYFDTMGLRLIAGRTLARDEPPKANPRGVVVNEAFVRHFFPDRNPLGKLFGAKSDAQIIGVVSDAKYRSLREPITPIIYGVERPGDFVMYVRTRERPETVIQPVRRALAALDAALPFTEIHTLAEEAEASTAGERLTAALASLFGALAAVLSAVGIYGLLADAVGRRRREIAIRMALGARPADIGQIVGGQALAMVGTGLAVGLAAVLVTTPLLRTLLYGVGPLDAVSLASAAGFISAAAAGAVTLPVFRATHVEPASALRDEN